MTFNIRDIWYVWILGRHKHDYERIEDGKTGDIFWQMHQCTTCEKTVGLDDWQIRDLPTDILYEKVNNEETR